MRDTLVEPFLEAAVFLVELGLFVLLTALGVLSEQTGIETVTSGDTIGFWYVYMGFAALYFGLYLVGYERLLPRLRRVRQSA